MYELGRNKTTRGNFQGGGEVIRKTSSVYRNLSERESLSTKDKGSDELHGELDYGAD